MTEWNACVFVQTLFECQGYQLPIQEACVVVLMIQHLIPTNVII